MGQKAECAMARKRISARRLTAKMLLEPKDPQAQADKMVAKLPTTGLCSTAINGIGRTKAAVATSAYLTAAASALVSIGAGLHGPCEQR